MTLRISNLNKSFSKRNLFKNFTLSASPSEMIAITGSSGSGKTTLLNIIGLLDFDYDGTYDYDGHDLRKINGKERSFFLRTKIGYLFQNYSLIDNETVYANLDVALYKQTLNKNEKKEKMINALERVGLNDSFLDMKILLLSGGEQQRIALARLLLKQSEIILADEPTGNLDNDNEKIVINLLNDFAKEGKIVIVVTHNRDILKYFNKVITLD